MLDYNPYDFANPVSDRPLFSGRTAELEELGYYLDQALKAPRPINIALLGDRASGKTSLLNMIEALAHEKSLCVARIDLNESDTRSPLDFFFKIFDSVLGAACEHPLYTPEGETKFAFGGKTAKTYQSYLDMISAYEIPEERDFCPFLFPIQYAKARARNLTDVSISDQNLKNDLLCVYQTLGKPIVLLFDEGNVLSGHAILLQMLRNVFMNTRGFMLVMAGTPELFPVMDDVFSPIVRQFKKIEVKPFDSPKDTISCIKRPLEQIGLQLERVMDRDTRLELGEIHTMTGGRPYEIQLLCHFMFKRMQRGLVPLMTLSLDVLDDVLAELERGKDLYARPVITAVRQLPSAELNALNWLTPCIGRASFEQLWAVEYLMNGTRRYSKDSLLKAAEKLSNAGIIGNTEHSIAFLGDDFDRLYCKYFARKRGRRLEMQELSIDVHATTSIVGALSAYGLDLFRYQWGRLFAMLSEEESGDDDPVSHSEPFLITTVTELSVTESAANACRSHPSLAAEVFPSWLELAFEGKDRQRLFALDIKLPQFSLNLPFYVDESGKFDTARVQVLAADLDTRARELGGVIRAEEADLSIPSTSEMAKCALESGNDRVRAAVGTAIATEMVSAYLEKEESSRAWELANMALPLADSLGLYHRNNLAYLCLATAHYTQARELLALDRPEPRSPQRSALRRYNLAIALAMLGEEEEALVEFEDSAREAAALDESSDSMGCLFLPTLGNDGLSLIEGRGVRLSQYSAEAAHLLRSMIEKERENGD